MVLSRERQNNLLRFGYRVRIWALFHLNPNQFFTVDEISERTGLRLSTVEQGLKFVKQLPLVQTRVTHENGRKIVRYGVAAV